MRDDRQELVLEPARLLRLAEQAGVLQREGGAVAELGGEIEIEGATGPARARGGEQERAEDESPSRALPEPSAMRSAISRRRWEARASTRLATLAQEISSTIAATPMSSFSGSA